MLQKRFVWCSRETTGCLYPVVRNLFGFLHEIFDLTPESIRESSNRLVEAYPEDLEHDLADKLVQFCSFARSSSGLKQGDEKVSFELRLYRIASATRQQLSENHSQTLTLLCESTCRFWQRIAQESGIIFCTCTSPEQSSYNDD